MIKSPAYQAGVTAALYEERRFSGYHPFRFTNLCDRLDFALGYLDVSPNCEQAKADARTWRDETRLIAEPHVNYEPDGNVLFASKRR